MIKFKDLQAIDGAEHVVLANGKLAYKTDRSGMLWMFNDNDVLVETDIPCEPESNVEHLEEEQIWSNELEVIAVRHWFNVRVENKIIIVSATELQG